MRAVQVDQMNQEGVFLLRPGSSFVLRHDVAGGVSNPDLTRGELRGVVSLQSSGKRMTG